MGKAHERLLDRLISMRTSPWNGDPAPYRNVLPVYQSSGMGKSRTVDELAKMVFTIPICLSKGSLNSFTLSFIRNRLS